MNQELLNILTTIKDEIKNSEEYKNFLVLEKELNDNDEVKILAYKKDMAIVDYEDNLKHFNKNSKEVLSSSERLSKSVYELNNHPIVKKYNKSLESLNKLYDKINKEVINPIIK